MLLALFSITVHICEDLIIFYLIQFNSAMFYSVCSYLTIIASIALLHILKLRTIMLWLFFFFFLNVLVQKEGTVPGSALRDHFWHAQGTICITGLDVCLAGTLPTVSLLLAPFLYTLFNVLQYWFDYLGFFWFNINIKLLLCFYCHKIITKIYCTL